MHQARAVSRWKPPSATCGTWARSTRPAARWSAARGGPRGQRGHRAGRGRTGRRSGEQLLLTGTGVQRSALPPYDGQWAWVASVTPPFEIEGRSVAEFLAWAARETGREVAYTTPAAAQRAQGIVLRGSVSGLAPNRRSGPSCPPRRCNRGSRRNASWWSDGGAAGGGPSATMPGARTRCRCNRSRALAAPTRLLPTVFPAHCRLAGLGVLGARCVRCAALRRQDA